ncbi:MAG: hypothetical protein WBA12_11115, partial [Catalinimonas sp.]
MHTIWLSLLGGWLAALPLLAQPDPSPSHTPAAAPLATDNPMPAMPAVDSTHQWLGCFLSTAAPHQAQALGTRFDTWCGAFVA